MRFWNVRLTVSPMPRNINLKRSTDDERSSDKSDVIVQWYR